MRIPKKHANEDGRRNALRDIIKTNLQSTRGGCAYRRDFKMDLPEALVRNRIEASRGLRTFFFVERNALRVFAKRTNPCPFTGVDLHSVISVYEGTKIKTKYIVHISYTLDLCMRESLGTIVNRIFYSCKRESTSLLNKKKMLCF